MKMLGRLVALVVLLLAVAGLLLWRAPLWTSRQVTHFGLFLSRVQSNYVMTPEGRVHYYEAEASTPGGGIPLVLVHGLADRSESWAPMLRKLKRAGFHVYAPDLLGAGRSPMPEGADYSIAAEEKFVGDFIDSLGLQHTSLGGWSMGGFIAMKLANEHPEKIDRVVIYDAAGLAEGMPEPPANVFEPKSADDVYQLFALMEPHAKRLPERVADGVVDAMQEHQAVIHAQLADMKTRKDALDDKLGNFSKPLLIVWGKDDRLVPLAVGQKFHTLVPNSELDIVEGCGHLAPLYCAGRVAAATADYLKANPAPAGQVRTLTAMGR
ncbi:alpha/beta fold hydrolase [Granulicella cerasi]|uniref:Alpha/beta fold hydrolase n=1 Tax=Granulicella cerasi TaxID=741063 RepID=A0ABW1ZD72_9BACT|nr:alpha/beta hydrolase [Granulicella cerasi]